MNESFELIKALSSGSKYISLGLLLRLCFAQLAFASPQALTLYAEEWISLVLGIIHSFIHSFIHLKKNYGGGGGGGWTL